MPFKKLNIHECNGGIEKVSKGDLDEWIKKTNEVLAEATVHMQQKRSMNARADDQCAVDLNDGTAGTSADLALNDDALSARTPNALATDMSTVECSVAVETPKSTRPHRLDDKEISPIHRVSLKRCRIGNSDAEDEFTKMQNACEKGRVGEQS